MQPFDELLREAVAFHGHLCPGQVLGVRMALAGCRALGIAEPKRMHKNLVVFVEIDRCASDAIQIITGCSLGKRTRKHLDYGKMAATFVNVATGDAVRVVARDDARERAGGYAPGVTDPREAQIAAYRVMPEAELLSLTPVVIRPGWLDRRRVRVFCQLCGEGVNYGLEVVTDGLTLCRACFAGGYYVPRIDSPDGACPCSPGDSRNLRESSPPVPSILGFQEKRKQPRRRPARLGGWPRRDTGAAV